jgi:hypothetical protein
MELKVVLEKQEEGGYTAYVPSRPECISEEMFSCRYQKGIELYLLAVT